MPIRFHCQDCDAKIKVPEGAEGRKVKCPRCGAVHRVPAAEGVVASVQPATKVSPTRVDLESLASAVGEFPSDSSTEAPKVDLNPQVGADPDLYVPERQTPDQEEQELEEQELNDLDPDEPDSEEQDLDVPDLEDEDLDEEDLDEEDLEQEEFNESFDDQQVTDDDPLAALASMADNPGPDEATELDEDEPEEPTEELFEPAAEPAFPSPVASVLVKSSGKGAIPLARPKPQAAAPVEPAVASATVPPPGPRPASPEPRAIPLSSKPAVHRPKAKPIPLDESVTTATMPYQPTPPASLTVLLILGWLLRVLAVLATGGAVKLALVASKESFPSGDCLMVLLYGLAVAVMIWALGEIALAVRYMASGRSGGSADT